MGQAVQPAPAASQVHYERRRPEETTLYQVAQEYLESFLAEVETETGANSPASLLRFGGSEPLLNS
jgi:hypothetical protein